MSALTVLYLILPLPFACMIHEAEEAFFRRKLRTGAAFPCLHTEPDITVHPSETNGCSLAMAAVGELAAVFLATAYVLAAGAYSTELWCAVFMVFSLHLAMHIVRALLLRGYVPGLVTALLFMPLAYIGMKSVWNFMSIEQMLLWVASGGMLMGLWNRFAGYACRKCFGR